MLLPRFEFHEPTRLEEACELLARFGPKAKVLAGGTDLIVNMKRGLVSPEHVVSLGRIERLKAHFADNGCYRIGAGVTVAQLVDSDAIRGILTALHRAAMNLGTPLIRNLATIGGNLGSARPAADLPPPLIVCGARAVLKQSSGERKVPLDKFFAGAGLSEIRPEEILTEIEVDPPPEGAGAGYAAIGIRKAQDCNLVNAAAFLALEADGETISAARIVMGCVGPTHLRSPSAEAVLTGEKVDPKRFADAAAAASSDSRPIDDFRGSAAYKYAMVGVLTRRALELALEEARKRRE